MHRFLKTCLILGGICLGIGLILGGATFGIFGFRWRPVSSYTQETYDAPASDVQRLSLELASDNVIIEPSDDRQVHLSWYDSKLTTHDVQLRDGTLSLTTAGGSGHWYDHITFGWMEESHAVVVQIPAALESIEGSTASGDFQMHSVSVTGALTAETASGDIALDSMDVGGALHANSVSGHTELNAVTADSVEVGTISGSMELNHVSSGDTTLSTTSGDIAAEDTGMLGTVSCSSVSGDMQLERVTVQGGVSIGTTSGDISANLSLNPQDYSVETSTTSGSVDVPQGNAGGKNKLSLSTVSGDIQVSFLDA